MSKHIIQLNRLAQELEAQGAWLMAQTVREIIMKELGK